MDVLVTPTARLQGELQALSSKNYTTRYLLVAALAEGTSTIHYPAHSEDSEAMRRCIRDLGAVIEEDDEKIVDHRLRPPSARRERTGRRQRRRGAAVSHGDRRACCRT